MATSNINMRIDEKLKSQLQELMSNLGLDVTTFFTMAAKQAVREQAIPFKASMETPNMDTLKAMAETEYLINNPNAGKTYDDVDDMLGDILK